MSEVFSVNFSPAIWASPSPLAAKRPAAPRAAFAGAKVLSIAVCCGALLSAPCSQEFKIKNRCPLLGGVLFYAAAEKIARSLLFCKSRN
jgi:hypothetical protein